MAKATDIDVTPWEPYGAAAARIVRVRTQDLFANAENVLDMDDIERVHDMRVASRRLRAVLEIFAPCFPKGEYRDVLRDVKRLADALGERRDPDVHFDAMNKLAERVASNQRAGIQRVGFRQRERQERGNAVLSAELARIEATGLEGRLLTLADHAEQRIAS
jgi:CHAD domain-containing protein